MSYADFLDRKKRVWSGLGIDPRDAALPPMLYDWQAAVVRWALRKGRAAIFADCGLGKSFMQCAWMAALGGRGIILAPLCVAEQTVSEAARLSIDVHYAKDQSEADGHQFVITNYERLDKFDASAFTSVVLDESSILKAFDGKTRTALIETFKATPYRLCCTATPSPNDIAELANHAEFLGLQPRNEFLATWFVHDDAGWRMKKHAVQPFYRWLASWAVAFRKPSDLGYDDTGFELPPLSIRDCIVESDASGDSLFPELGQKGLKGALTARRDSLEARVKVAARLATTGRTGPHKGCQWIFWCGLNPESEALTDAIPDSVNLTGSDSYAVKRDVILGFLKGDIRVLNTKISIAGYGMNFQNCHHMGLMGLGFSFEFYYQAIRRCWRFGQLSPVTAHVIVSDRERSVVETVRRKEQKYSDLTNGLLAHMRDFEREELIA